jgi:hypothetical protein
VPGRPSAVGSFHDYTDLRLTRQADSCLRWRLGRAVGAAGGKGEAGEKEKTGHGGPLFSWLRR